VTGDASEARVNRKLQLIVSNSFSGKRGKTLLEKMEDALDRAIKERSGVGGVIVDEQEREIWLMVNKGQIGMAAKMLAIMRSTDMKTEYERAKIRRDYAGREGNRRKEDGGNAAE
jgi:hypothetical protein